VVRNEADWYSFRRQWENLYEVSPTASTALDFTWLYEWWRVYRSSFRAPELCIVTVWRGERLIGALPLYFRREARGALGTRRLSFISTGEPEFEETCADYLNVLFLPGEKAATVEAMWHAIDGMSWDRLELLDLPQDSPMLNAAHRPRSAQLTGRGKCPIADLADGFEAYLGRLSSNRRQHARKLMRDGEKAGARLEVVTPEDADQAFDDLVRLHQSRWTAVGKPGVFAAPRFLEFHRQLVRRWLPSGRAVLARLEFESVPLVVLYGFVTGTKFDFYQSGVAIAAAGRLRSPGNLAHLMLMKTLADRGIREYDFLRGASTHKERLATHDAELVALEAWRPTLASALSRSADIAGRAARKGWRLMAGDS